jgi:heptosyltransferase-2
MTAPLVGDHILIVRLAALGDLVMTSVLLERIRHERPDAKVTWLCGAGGAPLVRLFPGVDRVISVDEQRLLRASPGRRAITMLDVWRRLVRHRFSDVLIAHVDRRFALIALPCRGARVAMLSREISTRTNPIQGRFYGDEYARLLDSSGGVGPITHRYEVADVRGPLAAVGARVLLELGHPLVVLAPGGARNVLRDAPMRRWPLDRYAVVARALIDRGCEVAIVGDAADRWTLDAFAGLGVRDLVGRLSLEQTLNVLARGSLVVSHDTGPMHLARAVRAPLIALFGPTMPRQMLGATPPTVVALWGGDHLPCRPCYNGREFANCQNNLCMQDISAAEVITHAMRLLDLAAVPVMIPNRRGSNLVEESHQS